MAPATGAPDEPRLAEIDPPTRKAALRLAVTGTILFAVLGTLVAFYFLPPRCEGLTNTEMCFDCLRTRRHESLCWTRQRDDIGPAYDYWFLFSYYRAPRADEWDIRDPRQAGCRHRYITCWANETTDYGPFFTRCGWGSAGEPGNESPADREMRMNIWVRRDLLLKHGAVLDAATRERFLTTIHDSLGQGRIYVAAIDALGALAPGSGPAALEAWFTKYFGAPAPSPPPPAGP